MSLRADDIKRIFARYHERLIAYRDALNQLNVYPVPDGDTGTNMSLTLGSVVAEIEAATTMPEVAHAIAHGSLMGARGNSGVILSQILRGLADAFRHETEVGVSQLASALDLASDAAYAAVQRPVEGTILTVLREAAEAAADSDGPGEDLAMLMARVYARSVEALERTPDMLPVLRQAGVVDAGGAGLLLLFSSFLEVVGGVEVQLPERVLSAHANLVAVDRSADVARLRYEVMFFLEAEDSKLPAFRAEWELLGDSVVVVGGDGVWNCHIHTDEIGPAVEAGIHAGRPREIRVTDLSEHAGDLDSIIELNERGGAVGVVAVAAGSGLAKAFRELGVQAVVSGGQSMNPSIEDVLKAVDAVPADQVIVLPNNKNIVPVAEQIDALSKKWVKVVPTRSVPQGIAAMFGYSARHSDLATAAEDMAAAASSIVDGEITRAVRDANVAFGSISKGDWLGIADGTVVVCDSDLEAALRGLVAAILPPFAEVLTLYCGADSHPAVTKALVAWLSELHPDLEVTEVRGGQPLYPYLVSIE